MIFSVPRYGVTRTYLKMKTLKKNWFEKGVGNVFDIIDVNWNIYTFEQLKEIYNQKGTFLDYQRLIKKIPRHGRKQIMNTQLSVKT